MAVVYLATNTLNGHRYVGVTKGTIAWRRSRHFTAARRGVRSIFMAAIRKYGEAAFAWSVIAEYDDARQAWAGEVEAISRLRPEYNQTTGGDGAPGRKVTTEQRQKMAAAKRGTKASPETIESLKRSHTEERRRRASLRMKGRTLSVEARGKWAATYAAQGYGKAVLCLDDGRWFKSSAAAGRHYGISQGQLNGVCRGRSYSAHGRHFCYADKPIPDSERLDLLAQAKARRKRRVLTPEHKAKLIAANTARVRSPEERARIGAGRRGKRHSEDTKRRIAECARENIDVFRRYIHLGHQAASRRVVCVDDGLEYNSASEAARTYGVARSALIELCLGRRGRKTVGGLRFAYVGAS